MSKSAFSERLAHLLATGGQEHNGCVSQMELAAKIGVTRQAISSYVNGITSPPLDKVLQIADFFGVTLDYLAGRAETQRAENANINQRIGLTDETIACIEGRLARGFVSPVDSLREKEQHTMNAIFQAIVASRLLNNITLLNMEIDTEMSKNTGCKGSIHSKNIRWGMLEDEARKFGCRVVFGHEAISLRRYELERLWQKILSEIIDPRYEEYMTFYMAQTEENRLHSKTEDDHDAND